MRASFSRPRSTSVWYFFRNAFATARATYSRTVPEDITVNDRLRIYYEITEALMRSLDVELEKNIRQHLAPYLL